MAEAAQLHWYRTESHASPLGYELRASHRGRTWRMWRLADGQWRVKPTDRPQQERTFWKPEEARKYASQAAMTNPSRKRNPQGTNMAKKKTKNPMRGARKAVSKEIDEQAAQELRLYIDNDGDLYRRRRIPIEKNLTKKWKKGVFNAARAVDAYMYLVEDGAKKYAKEFASPSEWNKIFTKATRDYVADEYATDFAHDISEDPTAYDHLLEKNPPKTKKYIVGSWRLSSVPLEVTAISPRDAAKRAAQRWWRGAEIRGITEEEKSSTEPDGQRFDVELLDLKQWFTEPLYVREYEANPRKRRGNNPEYPNKTGPFFPIKATIYESEERPYDNAIFDAWTAGDLWNGAITPYFEKRQADRVLAYHKRDPYTEGGQSPSKAYYDRKRDAYVIEWQDDPEQTDVWSAEWIETPKGRKKVYPIGAYAYTWQELEGDAENNPSKPCRKNPSRRKKNGAGLGALIGSTIGAVAGFGAGSVPLAALGSLAGGTVGGYLGAPKDRKKRGAAGGAIGGALLGPVGAGIGGYVGGRRADADYGGRRSNPGSPTREQNPSPACECSHRTSALSRRVSKI